MNCGRMTIEEQIKDKKPPKKRVETTKQWTIFLKKTIAGSNQQ